MSFFKAIAVAALISVSAGQSLAGFAYPARTMQSTVLGRTVEYSLIVPMEYLRNPDLRLPVLFALHGHSSSYTAYTSMQNIKDSVEVYPMMVVAFNAGNTYYADETPFLIAEFKPFIDSVYRTDGQYAITGFSMGGYGSFHFMLNHPDLFKSVSAKSGAFYSQNKSLNTRLAAAKDAGTDLPPLYMNCGTADSWISNQREMKDTLTSLGYAYEYFETAGADHDYTFWHAAMAKLIPWHGSYFDYTSAVHDGMVRQAAAAVTGVAPNPSHGSFTMAGVMDGTVRIMTTDGRQAGSVPVVNGAANWKTALPGLSGGVYIVSSDDGAVQARVMLVR